jgi:poly-beta-1,6-N-acetyl-D-glucosamine synthase
MIGRLSSVRPRGAARVEPPGVFRPTAARPIPSLRPVPDFVGLPDGGRSLPVETKLAIAGGSAIGWLVVSAVVAIATSAGLASILSWPYALAMAVLTVGIPAGLAAFRVGTALLDKTVPVLRVRPTTPVTVVMTSGDPALAASTLGFLAAQDYDGAKRVVVVDCGRGDVVARESARAALVLGLDLEVEAEPPGMLDARNAALEHVGTPLVLAVEPGACLHPSALRLLVARLESEPPITAAVSAHTLVRNRDPGRDAEGLAAGWSLELDAARRSEAMFAGPLAVDGTCTLFRTDALRAVNGWPGGRAGDVLLAWRFLERGGRVVNEPLAIACATTIVTMSTPARFRADAARAVRQAARDGGGVRRLPERSSQVMACLDRAAPALDLAFTLAWVQALALVALGQVTLVAAHLVLVVPLALAGSALERRRHREVLDEAGLALVAPHEVRGAALVGLLAVQGPVATWRRIRGLVRVPPLGGRGVGVTPRRWLGGPARPYA